MNTTPFLPPELIQAFESVPDSYLILSPELIIQTASDAYLLATEMTRGEIVGKLLTATLANVLDSGAANDPIPAIQKAISTRKPSRQFIRPYRMDARSRLATEPTRWKILNTPVLDADGRVQYIIHRIEVQSEKPTSAESVAPRSENAYVEETRRLKEAQTIGHVGSFEWTLGDEITYWSDELYRIIGLEPQSATITMNLTARLVHPEDQPRMRRIKEKSLRVPGFYQLIHRILLPNGTIRWVNHRFESLTNAEGQVVRIRGTVQDISEQYRVEQELKQKNALLQAVLDTPNLGLTVYKSVRNERSELVDFEFVFVSKKGEQLVGRTDLPGKRVFEEFPEYRAALEQYRRVIETGVTERYEIPFSHGGVQG